MKYIVSLAAILAGIALVAPAHAGEIKGNIGAGSLSSISTGGAAGGGAAALAGYSNQAAASVGSAGAQLTIKPNGVTLLTQQSSQFNATQLAVGLAGGTSFGGTYNQGTGNWAGFGGALHY